MTRVREKVKVECANCGEFFDKTKVEVKRSLKAGRRHFCSRSCACALGNKEIKRKKFENLAPDNLRDELTPFRWFMLRVNNRRDKKGSTDLTVERLKEIWLEQDGICPFTGWKMELPISTVGWADGPRHRRASLDRIDNAKGYVEGNVRFVCCMANWARNKGTDSDLMIFCKAVAGYNKL